MKIGYICTDTSTYSQGFLWNEIRLLEQNGHEVTVFCKRHNKKKTLNVKAKIITAYHVKKIVSFNTVIFLYGLLFKALLPAIRLYKLERKNGASIDESLRRVYYAAHLLPYSLDYLVYSFTPLVKNRTLIPKAMKTKMVICLRGYDGQVDYATLNGADKLFVRSLDLYQYAVQKGLSSFIPYQVIPAAVHTEKIRFIPTSVSMDVLRIVSVGRLHWKKGYEYTLAALRQLYIQGIPFTYTIVGSGEEEDKLKFMVQHMGLQSAVHFVGDKESQEVYDCLYRSHLFLHASISEGCSNAVIEAQAAGVFCIASNIPGNNIIDGVTGFSFDVYDYSSLYFCIGKFLLLDAGTKSSVLHAARKHVEEVYSIERLTKDLNLFYSSDRVT